MEGSGSEGEADIHAVAGEVRIGAHGVRFLDQLGRRGGVDAGQRDLQRHLEREAAPVVARADADIGGDACRIGDPQLAVSGDEAERTEDQAA